MSRQSALSSGPIYHPFHAPPRSSLSDARALSYGVQTQLPQTTLPFRPPSASLSGLGYHHPTHPPLLGPSPAATLQLHQQARPAGPDHASRMTTGYAPPLSEEELAHLQKLSNEYEPEVTGPLVGELQQSTNITTEYARADPIYIKKTEALPNKYSNYRACRGDGNCGWRAIAFAYFEALVRVGDKTKIHAEVTRLKSFQNILDAAGFQFELYEDFAEELYDLLRKTAASLPPPDNGNPTTDVKAIVLAAFNDESIQASIITFLRILSSGWIKTRAEDYQPFLMNEDVFSYCGRAIEPFRQEIEHVGISALCDVLLKPAGFSLEILYLDRSPGDEMNIYTFDADYPIAHLRLLYRPGHYDILYKSEDVQQQLIHTYMGTVPSHAQDHTDSGRGLDYLHSIPGISIVSENISPYSYGDSGFPSPISTHPPPMQHSLSVHPIPAHPAPAPTYAPPPLQMPTQSISVPRLPMHPSQNLARAGPFRHSAWEYEPSVASGPPPQFTTSIFRNSHYNTAHFLNPDFEPEQWSPDAEYVTSNNSGRRRNGH